MNLTALSEDDQAHNAVGHFLYDQHAERKKNQREMGYQTGQHCNLRQLVGNGIERFSDVADHVEMPRDKTVQRVCDPGEKQNKCRTQIVLLSHIQPDKPGDQQQTYCRKHIGDRQDPVLHRVFFGIVHRAKLPFSLSHFGILARE